MHKSLSPNLKEPIRLLCVLICTCVIALAVNAGLSVDVSAASNSAKHVSDFQIPPAAPQSIITVINNHDSGAGSLRQAILDAGSGDTIVFAPEVSGTITLTTGDLMITKSLTIQGPGAEVLAVSGGNATGVFFVDGFTTIINVTLSGLTIRDGNTSGGGGGIANYSSTTVVSATMVVSNAGGLGGGIHNVGSLSVINSSVLSNVSGDTGGGINNLGTLIVAHSAISGNKTFAAGGGINGSCTSSTTMIQNSTIANNRAVQHAGGIGLCTGTTLIITNTTISGNVSESAGGGGLDIYGTASIFNSTVVNNSAISGGGIRNLGGVVKLKNSIVANNVSGNNCVGTIQSDGHNLSSSATCHFTSTGDLQNVAPQIGPLADNGGQTPTHLLLPGSSAINSGDSSGCPADDQRGVPRPQARICDIGAVEVAFPNTLYVPIVLR
jgi:hypothetical protein